MTEALTATSGFARIRAVIAPPETTSTHTVAAAFVASAVARLNAAQRNRVLAHCGLPAAGLRQPGARVASEAFARLWLAVAKELDDEFFGLDTRRMKVGSFALLCRAASAHRSIGGGLREAVRGFALLLDDLCPDLATVGRDAVLTLRSRVVPPAARRFADEAMLVMLYGILCWLAGRRVPLRQLVFGWSRPPHAVEYRRMFGANPRFDAAAPSSLRLDAGLLEQRSAASPASLRVFLRDAPQSVFLKQLSAPAWSERLRRRLRRGADWPDVGAVAAQWGISPATLRRNLAAEGTSWQREIDTFRRELAIHLLGDRRHSIEHVATSLGYGDVRSLHRAFRKWTGQPPGAFRDG